MTLVTINLIFGFTVGFEYVPDMDGETHWILEFGFFRVVITKEAE
jgi:hypothetical protein